MIPVPGKYGMKQNVEDSGLIFPMDCPECAKSTSWRLVSYRNRAGIGCLFLNLIPIPHGKAEYWLECQEGLHGFRFDRAGIEHAKQLDSLTRAYSQNIISENEYVEKAAHAIKRLKWFMSTECFKFPTDTESSDDEGN